MREIDAELRQKKKLTKKHRAGKGMLATAATATTVVAGGVVIGVATMGIGLVPYAVGIAGLAGGGAAYLKSSEKELHLELGSRDKKLADRWRSLIEDMVARRAAALDLAAGVDAQSTMESSRLVARPDRAVVLRTVARRHHGDVVVPARGTSAASPIVRGVIGRRAGLLGGAPRLHSGGEPISCDK